MKTLVVLTEELSAKVMLESLLPRLLSNDEYRFTCVAFEGKQDLEKQLPIKLKGWRTPDTHFVVLRDQDSGDCRAIKTALQGICRRAKKPSAMVRIVCRELENWYFGDLQAVETALGVSGLTGLEARAKYRNPDTIHNASAELKRVTKNCYQKVSGSRAIGRHLRLEGSRSRSFQHFISGVSGILGLESA